MNLDAFLPLKNIADQISFGALIVAIFSLLLSIRGYYLSKEALRISKIQHQDRYRDISGYLINCYKWIKNEHQYASFAISYTNNSSEPNSFKDILLEIEYYDNSSFNKAKLSPNTGLVPTWLPEGYEELTLPINLGAKETKSGWISFKLPKIREKCLRVDCYRIVATSTRDEITNIETHLIRNIFPNE